MRGRARKVLTAFLTGAFMVAGAWAGASLTPAGGDATSAAKERPASLPGADAAVAAQAALDPSSLPAGQVLVGAAKTSIRPDPQKYGGTWETSAAKCKRMDASGIPSIAGDDHVAGAGNSPWHENPNCIYMGGFGIGPQNPVTRWPAGTADEPDLFVRALALRDREGDDLVMVILDGEGWFWDYGRKCSNCGIKQLTDRLEKSDLGLEAQDVIISTTHSHAAPDFIGGWGFVPNWYMKQVSETILSTVEDAVRAQEPAVLEHGEEEARDFNKERRNTYRSAEEQNLAWLRAIRASGQSGDPEDTIATLGAYAAHPTTKGSNGGLASPDWPGFFEAQLEQRFGGIGLHFMTGLGNLSASHLGAAPVVKAMAGLLPENGAGARVADPDIKTSRATWEQPATNVPLTALGTPGFFDRKFIQKPAELRTGKDPKMGHCVSASPASVEVAVSAARIGELAFTAAPGEIFANYSNTIKEVARAKLGSRVAFPLGQANDALGYMPQSFELHPVGQQGPGFVAGGAVFVNYEDAYSIDKCFGDHALETSIGLLEKLGK